MTSYENIGATAFRGHAVRDRYNSQWYYYDANGNMTARWTSTGWQNMSWDHENRLSGVSGASLPTESYLYDTDGQRVRKTSNGVNTYYPNQYYEQSGSTITKYYYFNGQRVAIRTNALGGWAHYDLHGDHLGSTVFMTNQGLTYQTGEGYYAYGRNRSGNIPLTDHKFTGQKRDGTGLQYYNARYYDPELGQFLSPDTLVPDPGTLFDYNRYMYTRGNPMRYTDPTGHYSNDEIMKHFNCSDWACVEGHFGEGGSHTGMWGWLYMLQQAENGDSVTSTAIGRSYSSQMTGTFQMGKDGRILVNGQSLITYSDIVVSASIDALMPELGFAAFAANGDYGLYGLNGKTPTLSRDYQHNYLYVDPIEVLKAGADIGPMIVAGSPVTGPAAPVVAGVGKAYTALGLGATFADDYVVPLVQGKWDSLRTNAAQDVASFGAEHYLGPIGPWVSGGITAYGFAQGICYGTGCPR